MISPANDTPELTAYAMGELHPHQAGEIHKLLSDCPAALSELEQIEAMTDALRQTAPIPQDRLLPEQRHAVLHPVHIPRRMAPLQPRPAQVRRLSPIWPVLSGMMKAAAIVVVGAGAFLAGRHSGIDLKPSGDATVADASANEAPVGEAASPVVQTPAAQDKIVAQTPVPIVEAPVVSPSPAPAAAPAESEPKAVVVNAPPAAAPEKPVLAATVADIAPKMQPAPAPATLIGSLPAEVAAVKATPPAALSVFATTIPGKDLAFVSASRQAVSEFALRPANIRPQPAKGEGFASPLVAKPAGEAAKDKDKQPRVPDVYIHSWKAEVASCPWNESHRLMRVYIQLPADQPAAMSQAAYPLKVTFDPTNVRDYRQLCERHQPATELRSAGTHVVWYEFQPNGDSARDTGKIVATVTLENGRFSTQTVGPFDSSKMSVQDRGQTWQTAREEFIFDSSVVAFGLLLRGVPHTPGLNHELVLNLAQKSKGADTNGERSRFIRLVTDARKAAGL